MKPKRGQQPFLADMRLVAVMVRFYISHFFVPTFLMPICLAIGHRHLPGGARGQPTSVHVSPRMASHSNAAIRSKTLFAGHSGEWDCGGPCLLHRSPYKVGLPCPVCGVP